MPRRFRDYLDRLSRRNAPERRTINMPVQATNPVYTVNTTINLDDWQPTVHNTTEWHPADDRPSRVYHHDMDDPTAEVFPGRTVRPSEVLRRMFEENMTAREYEELANRNNDYVVPENMLRLVRVVPNLTANDLVEVRPMDPPNDDWGAAAISRATNIPASYFSANYNEPITYTPYWSNKTISWPWGDRSGGHVEYRRGKIIRVKRYCKI